MRHIKKNIEICITSGELSERSISGLNRLSKPEVTSADISPADVEPESTTLHLTNTGATTFWKKTLGIMTHNITIKM
jgi:hypothetical protein